jgi:arylsulfatase A-like enzyme
VTGFEDWLPTLLELIGAKEQTPGGVDGISFAPTLRGETLAARPVLYRESPGYGGQQCVRVGDWKLVRQNLNAAPNAAQQPTTELYNLSNDPGETTDVAATNPEVVEELTAIAREQRVTAKLWPIRALDNAQASQTAPAAAARESDSSDSDANPAMCPITDDPKLPRVLLVSDSMLLAHRALRR